MHFPAIRPDSQGKPTSCRQQTNETGDPHPNPTYYSVNSYAYLDAGSSLRSKQLTNSHKTAKHNLLLTLQLIRRTKSVQSRGAENFGEERTDFESAAVCAVHGSSAITPEFLWNFRPTQAGESVCSGDIGGAVGVRITGTVGEMLTTK